jgi:hypothetical protein
MPNVGTPPATRARASRQRSRRAAVNGIP